MLVCETLPAAFGIRTAAVMVAVAANTTLNWEKDMLLSTENIDELTKLLSKKMNVSFQAMSYRLNNLEVFVDIE